MATPFDPQDLEPGTVVGDYVVERKVGKGSFGTVYEGRHPLIGKRVAIKVLSRDYAAVPATVERFIAEARVVNEIHHRNIVDIFAFDELPDGRPYFVMEYLDGPTLQQHLEKKGKLPLDEALPLLRQIASALDAAHRRDVAHRDVKPANIMLPLEEGRYAAKLIDFGIAKLSGRNKHAHETQSGSLVGTPRYMAPEQWRGKVDHRSDVYAFGLIAYEMLTGRAVFEVEENVDLMRMHCQVAPPRASQTNPELPAGVDGPILASLEKDPEKRPDVLVPMVDELERVLGTRSRKSRGRTYLLAGVVGIVAVAGFLVVARPWLATAPTPMPDAVVAMKPVAPPLSPDPAPVPAEPPAHPSKVHVVVEGGPAGAKVTGPQGNVVGMLPSASFDLPWSKELVHLGVSRPGFETKGLDLVPAMDLHLSTTLPRVTHPAKAPKVSNDRDRPEIFPFSR